MRRPFPRTPRRRAHHHSCRRPPRRRARRARARRSTDVVDRDRVPRIGGVESGAEELLVGAHAQRGCLVTREGSGGGVGVREATAAAAKGSAARQVGAHASGDMVRAGASSSGPAQRIGRGGVSHSRPISADLGRSRRYLAAAAQRVPQKRRVDQARRDQARLVGAGGGLLQQGKGRTSETSTSAPRRHRYSLFYCDKCASPPPVLSLLLRVAEAAAAAGTASTHSARGWHARGAVRASRAATA